MRSLKAFTLSFQLWILLQCCTMKCITPSSLSLSTTHIQALDIQCTLWSPKYTPNDILDISKNYHLLLRYLYLPYTLHWYFFWSCSHQEYLKVFWDLHSNHLLFFSLFPSLIWHSHEIAVNWHFSFSKTPCQKSFSQETELPLLCRWELVQTKQTTLI